MDDDPAYNKEASDDLEIIEVQKRPNEEMKAETEKQEGA